MSETLFSKDANYVVFSRGIDDQGNNVSELLNAVLAYVQDAPGKEICLLVNSIGGSVISGLNAYNTLRSVSARLITVNIGRVESIANAIFLAGEQRYCTPQAEFMLHGVTFPAPNGVDVSSVNQLAASIASDHKRLASLLAARTDLTVTQASAIQAQPTETRFGACESLKNGFTHRIVEPPIVPTGASFYRIV